MQSSSYRKCVYIKNPNASIMKKPLVMVGGNAQPNTEDADILN